MRFKVGHPDFPAFDFYLLAHTQDVEAAVNELGPVAVVAASHDWPNTFGGYRGWTDTINSLWWPQQAEQFATCVLLIDDARNDLLTSCILAQKAAAGDSAVPPHLVLQNMLSPPEGERPGDQFPFAGVGPVTVETELIAWKMYPLSPINLTSLAADERFRGLWLLPLVDVRYFYRNAALPDGYGSSSASGSCDCGYPKVCSGDDDAPAWMPSVLTYPKDLSAPLYYDPIVGNGVQPTITGATPLGPATDLQSSMNGLRVVCRDVRSNYNAPTVADSHTAFTGVVCDYPEDFSAPDPTGYHQDALAMLGSSGLRKAGGLCGVATLDQFVAKKIQFLFEVESSACFYALTVQRDADTPTSTADFSVVESGPSVAEKTTTPAVLMGMTILDREPTVAETATMTDAAKKWCLLYNWWRTDQAYLRFPAIVPVIPNGHAQIIRWDFQTDYCYTTYVALEGVEGSTPDSRLYAAKRLPFYARIDGEGEFSRGLHGVYAYTELADADGVLSVRAGGRKGYVAGVGGRYATVNPARDESGKVAVPVGLNVWLKPGTPYCDITTGQVFDHYLFTTTDLVQIVRRASGGTADGGGFYAGQILRYNPLTNEFDVSKDILLKELT